MLALPADDGPALAKAAPGIQLAWAGGSLANLMLIYSGTVEVRLASGLLKNGTFIRRDQLRARRYGDRRRLRPNPGSLRLLAEGGVHPPSRTNPTMRSDMNGVSSEDLARKLTPQAV